MPTLARPAILHPENIVTNSDMLSFLDELHQDAPHKHQAFKMIENSAIQKRHMILPLEQILSLQDFGERGAIYQKVARTMAYDAASKALQQALLKPKDVTMVIVTSCTGFMMPSLTACLINDLGLPANTIQLPIAQLGCVAGASAVNRAAEHCKASKRNNVLIVSLETSSLCFHRSANRLQDFITDSLFGDGVASVVMRADNDCNGFHITHTQSHFMPDTEAYIQYTLTDSGFKFSLDKDVMYSISKAAPHIETFITEHANKRASELDFYIFHTGGRRIQDEVTRCLTLSDDALDYSRACLRDTGNTSSVAVIDVLARQFSQRTSMEQGVLAAFGPGFTTEMALGYWQ
ncbi:type III polyketide synthase [Pseudoalteromonas sp. MMG013]|uniref:Bacterial type III polyketide synthase n=1 Tax=Pseudoalteromonas aurantia 208 TaxID=1314867 RepID=A0ABR9EGP0_9GAMM|nr:MULTISPECIES: type III polyketide synthase [Pseudoalteromonas]MBE0368913.1 bacterial type III polyketide synthase [Pseudoalteromonas aurantia 208]MBQ4851420.1 type III polyketide synthase [Pseudoalteromonas sp. MMG012]MBQ4863287.1 type III polyketide synthase [Pseudoalteromonas sp. MMG013]